MDVHFDPISPQLEKWSSTAMAQLLRRDGFETLLPAPVPG